MDENFAVEEDAFAIGKFFRPGLSVSFHFPIVPVKTAPKYGTTPIIEVIFHQGGTVPAFLQVDQTDGIVDFAVDLQTKTTNDIGNVSAFGGE